MDISLEAILRRDRQVVVAALALVVLLSWAYLLAGAGMGMSALAMTRMYAQDTDMDMGSPLWTPAYALLMFAMWWIMMVAMMLPSAAPTVLLAAALNRRTRAHKAPYGEAGFFVAGYLLAWALFSALATAAQWGLEALGALSSMMQTTSTYLAGGLLLAAALWQFAPLKRACLEHCRSPMHFLTQRRRPGNAGALVMGAEHGAYCLGCCWFLMGLLFVGGVMNLYWIGGLAILVLLEKILPAGRQVGRLVGVGLGLWGIGLIAGLL